MSTVSFYNDTDSQVSLAVNDHYIHFSWKPRLFLVLQYPERMYTSKQGVTALDFSVANANLLAVSLAFLKPVLLYIVLMRQES